MIAENAGQDEARFSAVIEAVGAVMMKVAYEVLTTVVRTTMDSFEKMTHTKRLKYLLDETEADEFGWRMISARKELAGQIGEGQITSALATIKASTHHAKLMVRVHDRIVAEFPAGSEPVARAKKMLVALGA